MTHVPAGKDGRRTIARSKGNVERPFRTVKEAHETLYRFHQPQNEAEANLWLHRYPVTYNSQQHHPSAHWPARKSVGVGHRNRTGPRQL
jgi:hypothetical protein